MTRIEVTRISAYGLLCEANQILLCRLSNGTAGAGMWTLPGGGIDFGEHPEVAMIREVEEETGLFVTSAGIASLNSFRQDTPDRAFHGVRVIYHATVIGGELRNEVGGSTDMCQWHPLDSLDQIEVVELVEAALPMLGRRQTA